VSELRLNWQSPGPVATAFLRDKNFVSMILGPIGSGKSTTCVFKGLNKLKCQPVGTRTKIRRRRLGIIRQTYPELKTTTIRTWHEWLPATMGKWQAEGPPIHVVPFTLADGTLAELEAIFLALESEDDLKKLLSLELSDAWLNEARESPEEIIKHLQGRVGRFPPASDGGCVEPQIWADSNFPDTEHWIPRNFEFNRPEGYGLHKQPSGRSPKAENIKNLPVGYYDRAAIGQDESYIRVFIDAMYGFTRHGKPVFP